MKLRPALYVLSGITILIGAFLALPALVSFGYDEAEAFVFWVCAGATITAGLIVRQLTKASGIAKKIGTREGFFIVTVGWIILATTGSLPFYFTSDTTGQFTNFADAFFESMSGFTATGASILKASFEDKVIESLPKGVLFWRSLIQWIGGMGIILFSLAVLSVLGVGGMVLYRAEVPGPIPDKISPTVGSTAKILWWVYLLFTLIEFLMLWLFGYGMPAFEAICHTFTTMATSGFSVKDLSIGHYAYVGDSLAAYYEMVITFFMFLAGINFTLIFAALTGRPLRLFNNPEFRAYFFFLAFSVALFVGAMYINSDEMPEPVADLGTAVRHSLFTAVSIMTTSGFATADFDTWPNISRAWLIVIMFIGGCAGSTAGGMKVMRIVILIKSCYNELRLLLHSRAIFTIRMGQMIINRKTMRTIISFSILFFTLFMLGVLALASEGLDLESAFSASVAGIGNIGPGLGTVGPAQNYAHLTDFSKWVMSGLMLLGRLEIYPVLVLFIPDFWRK